MPSSPAVSTRRPSGLNDAAETGPRSAASTRSSGAVPGSQMRAVPSALAVATALPSGLKAPFGDRIGVAAQDGLEPSGRRLPDTAVPSALAVTRNLPSLLNEALLTALVCPSMSATRSPVGRPRRVSRRPSSSSRSASLGAEDRVGHRRPGDPASRCSRARSSTRQTAAVWSSPPVTKSVPAGLNEAVVTPWPATAGRAARSVARTGGRAGSVPARSLLIVTRSRPSSLSDPLSTGRPCSTTRTGAPVRGLHRRAVPSSARGHRRAFRPG